MRPALWRVWERIVCGLVLGGFSRACTAVGRGATGGRRLDQLQTDAPVPRYIRGMVVELAWGRTEHEERAAAAWACGSVGSWTVRAGSCPRLLPGGAKDVEARFRAAWREIAGEEWRTELHPRKSPDRDWLELWRAASSRSP